MGVYIPNMEKPERCRDCRLHSYDWGDEYIPSHDVCHALSIYFNKGYEERHIKIDEEVHPDCPLIEIIPCKECKNSHMTYDGKCKYCDLILDDDDNYIECYFDGDHFCGFGERRE